MYIPRCLQQLTWFITESLILGPTTPETRFEIWMPLEWYYCLIMWNFSGFELFPRIKLHLFIFSCRFSISEAVANETGKSPTGESGKMLVASNRANGLDGESIVIIVTVVGVVIVLVLCSLVLVYFWKRRRCRFPSDRIKFNLHPNVFFVSFLSQPMTAKCFICSNADNVIDSAVSQPPGEQVAKHVIPMFSGNLVMKCLTSWLSV